jgi:hypothetical protein
MTDVVLWLSRKRRMRTSSATFRSDDRPDKAEEFERDGCDCVLFAFAR